MFERRLFRAFPLVTVLAAGSILALAQDRPPPPAPGQRGDPAVAPAQPVPPAAPALPHRPPVVDDGRSYRFQATVFEVTGAPQQLLTLDAATLAGQAGNPAALQAVLSKIGMVSVRLRADQVVSSNGPVHLKAEGERAFVRGLASARSPDAGKKLIDTADVGTQMEFNPRPSKAGGPAQLSGDLSIRVRSLQFSSTGSDAESPTKLNFQMDQSQSTHLIGGKPIVLISMNGSSATDDATIAIVTLLQADVIEAAH